MRPELVEMSPESKGSARIATIVLVGAPGAGKTTVGLAVADCLDVISPMPRR